MLGSWATEMHAALCRCNTQYALYSQRGKLGTAEVRLVRSGTFAHMRWAGIQRGASSIRAKPPVVARQEWQLQLLEEWRWQPGISTLARRTVLKRGK